MATVSGAATFVVWGALGDLNEAFVRTVTVLVIACPHALGLAIPFFLTAFALDRFLAWFQRFRPYIVWVDRVAGTLLILLGILLVTDRFTLLASYLQGLTPGFLRSRL